jgi:RND family efflux transporter MFP subunit
MPMRIMLVIMLTVSGLMMISGCGPSADNDLPQAKPRSVRIEKIVSRNLPVMVRSVGRLVPNREVVVSAQVTGILMQINADVGTKVTSGETLVKLDPVDYTLALNEAQANLQSAQARRVVAEKNHARAKRLLPENVITAELFDQAEAEYHSSQALVSQLNAVVDIARHRLDKTNIGAPFDGYVTQRLVELGQNVAVGDPVMRIADMETMRVIIHVNENDYVHLDKDDPVTVRVEAFSNTPFPGRVDKIGIKADGRTNTFEIEILMDNPQFILKAGLTARVSIQTEVIPDAVMISQGSVLFREDRKEVFVIEQGNKAVARKVKLGRVDGSLVRILEGLMTGDNLVVSGAQYLKQGDEVVVKP